VQAAAPTGLLARDSPLVHWPSLECPAGLIGTIALAQTPARGAPLLWRHCDRPDPAVGAAHRAIGFAQIRASVSLSYSRRRPRAMSERRRGTSPPAVAWRALIPRLSLMSRLFPLWDQLYALANHRTRTAGPRLFRPERLLHAQAEYRSGTTHHRPCRRTGFGSAAVRPCTQRSRSPRGSCHGYSHFRTRYLLGPARAATVGDVWAATPSPRACHGYSHFETPYLLSPPR
jgi:hypothetical protein